MDNGGDDDWRVPVLFGAAAIGIYGAIRYFGTSDTPMELNQQSESKALLEDSAFDQQFEKLLDLHPELKPPNQYLDPITSHLMDDPIMLSDNQTYNRNTALYLLKYKIPSPITREPLFDCVFEPNDRLRDEIQGWIAALNFEYNQRFSFKKR